MCQSSVLIILKHQQSNRECEAHQWISIYIIQFVCLFVCDSGKSYCTGRHQTLRDYKVGLQKCPPQVEIARLAVLEELSFHFQFSFAADGQFINYHSLTSGYWAVRSLIRCHPTIEFKLGCCYSSYPPLLTAQILQISLGPTWCRTNRRSSC